MGSESTDAQEHVKLDPLRASLLILSNLDYLSRRFSPSVTDLLVDGRKVELSEPFCIEMTVECLNLLYSIMHKLADPALFSRLSKAATTESGDHIKTQSETGKEINAGVYVITSCLRLMKVNLYRLILSHIHPSALGLGPNGKVSFLFCIIDLVNFTLLAM